ncbi:MAG: hypothetical protein IPL87_04140 [Candidatus Moraniibacteriota bacterium]|nr:MAG: hypothetical protein IPL87_04140 [Candidatus Moranbacteria bacterium]
MESVRRFGRANSPRTLQANEGNNPASLLGAGLSPRTLVDHRMFLPGFLRGNGIRRANDVCPHPKQKIPALHF